MSQVLGLIETKSYVTTVAAADTMLGAAYLNASEYKNSQAYRLT